MLHNRFKRGSGCYECRICHYRTRATNRDGADVGLCSICYDICGLENESADRGDADGSIAKAIAELTAERDSRNSFKSPPK